METFTVDVAPPGPTRYTNITTEDLHTSPQLYFAVRHDFPCPLRVQILAGISANAVAQRGPILYGCSSRPH